MMDYIQRFDIVQAGINRYTLRHAFPGYSFQILPFLKIFSPFFFVIKVHDFVFISGDKFGKLG